MSVTIAVLAGSLFVYLLFGAVYRLFFAPAAGIPGPKLAALTLWYEYYHDVVKGGRYEFEIAKMHAKYGPIVRVNPEEIHISDPEFYDTLYTNAGFAGRKHDKWIFPVKMMGYETGMFSTTSHDLHRARRGVLNPFFSKQSILRLEPRLHNFADKLVASLSDAKAQGTVVNLSDINAAFAGDVIMDYVFGNNLDLLSDKDAVKDWRQLWKAICASAPLIKQFNIVFKIQRAIPPAITEWLDPRFRLIFQLTEMLFSRVSQTQATLSTTKSSPTSDPKSDPNSSTILHALLENPLPPSERTAQRAVDECQSALGAGTITTAEILSAAAYHLISTPPLLAAVHAELAPIYATTPPGAHPPLTTLQNLPYLTAVLKETLRVYFGVTQRLPRINPDADMAYKSYTLPRGSPVSMSALNVHLDPSVWGPDAAEFRPERWLAEAEKTQSAGNGAAAAAAAATVSPLDRFLVSFGKGPRSCLGVNLAWAEMYVVMAAVFAPGRFGFELFETGLEDVRVVSDYLVPFAKEESLGVRMLVS